MQPYLPEKLPPDLSRIDWQKVAPEISRASSALVNYNGVLNSIPDPLIFLSPFEIREAVFSSHIEGTAVTVDEVLKCEAGLEPESVVKQADIVEVLNYHQAVHIARDWLEGGLPFDQTMACAIQNELMRGDRGRDKQPGEIRTKQVWVGARGCSIEEAAFIPPEPAGLSSYLGNWVDYINCADQDVLLQTAIMHARFEIIHPFCDGNGRTGRILAPLFLWRKGRISAPLFHMSEYFDENRDQYVACLSSIAGEHDWEKWLLFYLDAIQTQAKKNSEKATRVSGLYQAMCERIKQFAKSPYAMKVLDALFISPVMNVSDFIRSAGSETESAHRILSKLKSEGILITLQESAARRPEILVFDELYRIIC